MHPHVPSFLLPPRRRARSLRARWILAALGILAALACTGCGDDDKKSTDPTIQHPEDFLPQSVSGMTRDGAVQTATTTSELQALVDGGFQVYTSHGWRELAQQNYTGTVGGMETGLQARIFDQGAAENAAALHADENLSSSGCSIVNGLGDEGRHCPSFGSQSLQFRRDRYWVQVLIYNDTQDGRTVLDLFGQHVDGEIQGR